MSFARRVVTNFRLAFNGSRRMSRRLDELELKQAALERQIGQLQGGSVHTPGLNFDPPLVWLIITQIAEVGAAGRRLNLVRWGSTEFSEYAEHSKFEIDEDDTQLYLIETDATMPLVFVGARVLCVNTRLYPQGDYPAKALYRPIAGEVFGFYVRLFDPDENDRYPWKQVWPISHLVEDHPDHYTDETVPVVGGSMLGVAEPFERHAYDSQITERHRNYANTKVFLQCRSAAGFLSFNGHEEPEYVVCS